MIARRQIGQTYNLIAPRLRRTPVIDLAELSAVPVTLKLETLQHTGSFKPRGAFANMLNADIPKSGVAAASGGNHGAAVAYAASKLNHKARIFVPLTTPAAKLAQIRSYGAEVDQAGENYAAAFALCVRYARESGAMLIHAYDSEPTITGQGTLALELEEQAPDLDTILVGVGGGGLIAGIAAWYSSGLKIVGVEPESCPTLERALKAGRPVDINPSGVAADSLGASRIGEIPFSLASSYVDRALLVPDEAILNSQLWLWQHLRLLTEPGGATAFAALAFGFYRPDPLERIGIILCGANADPATFQMKQAEITSSPQVKAATPLPEVDRG
jgi:threonine dehydratase